MAVVPPGVQPASPDKNDADQRNACTGPKSKADPKNYARDQQYQTAELNASRRLVFGLVTHDRTITENTSSVDCRMLRTLLCLFLLLPTVAESRIERSAAEVMAFKRHNPCPSTGLRRGACPGYQVDHTVALCMGGEDKASNMAWLSVEDHRFKTFTDVRECRKFRKMANTPALQN